MMIRRNRFNIYLLLAVALSIICGCRSPESKRRNAVSTMEFYLEANRTFANQVSVYRANPVLFNVEREPKITEVNILSASVKEDEHNPGGFFMVIEFDRQGKWMLEQNSGANPGRHFIVKSQWAEAPDWKLNRVRILAAPQFSKPIKDGLLVFTPDATRQEAEQIALGLNNVSKVTHATESSKW
jgi:hypothetical protein